METVVLETSELDTAAQLLRDGEVVAFPTDTVYGVACVFDNEEAIEKMKVAKGRPESKPFPFMASSKDLIKMVAEVNERDEKIIDHLMPGALTIVLKKKPNVPDITTNGMSTIAIRMADDTLVNEIISKVGKPLLVTSANLSGEPSTSSYEEVYKSLQGRISAVVRRDATGSKASTIIDLTQPDTVKVLREGPISIETIEETIKRG